VPVSRRVRRGGLVVVLSLCDCRPLQRGQAEGATPKPEVLVHGHAPLLAFALSREASDRSQVR
jgi:hypothetical protein